MSCTDCLTPEVTPEEAGYYVLHTIDELGCENTDSVFVDVFFPIYIPNTFTPNGDGDNDVFLVQGENIRGFHLEIWNRWGELIFETDDPNEPWNGSKNGGEYYVQDGTYIYRVTYRIKAGSEELVGHVNLIR